ncbi:hypothetical protein SUGI_0496670 [Cryptomeria japonica]|nr:hypothetical protein SUGI_0496670 [Cryptomeria japonica]
MAALDDSRSGVGKQNRVTNLRYSSSQSTKVGSWSDEADIAFPIKTSRMQAVQEPDKAGVTDRFQGSKYSNPRLNHGNSYSSGNLCPIDPHKWKANGFSWNNKGWFRKANHLVSEGPRNWYPPPKRNTSDALLERDIPYTDSFLAPLTDHEPSTESGKTPRFSESRLSLSLSGPVFIIQGPYTLDGIEVHIIDWQPNFNPRTYVLPDSKVWIRLYNCPSDYWHIDVIKDICKNLGTFISVDDILEDKLWGSFLRICISTHQINKIPDEVRIIGAGKIWIQKIDREDQLHICPKCFSLDHSGISCDISATIHRNYSCMQSPIEDKLQPEPLITDDFGDALCNDTLEKENVTLTEATPLIIVPPSCGQSESQQDLLTLIEKTKSLQAEIESKIADSLPPSPYVPRNQLAIEDKNP